MSRAYWENNYRKYTRADACDGWLDAHAREILPGMAVLDLGCGTGTNLPALLEMDARVSAADLSGEAVALVQAHFGGRLQRVDCFDMCSGFPYEDASFDVVVADLSLHYFRWSDTQAILGGIGRILRSGGRLIARVHALKNLQEVPPQQIEAHYYIVDGIPRRYFTREEIETLLSDWKLLEMQERAIHRYGRVKHVLEFSAQKR